MLLGVKKFLASSLHIISLSYEDTPPSEGVLTTDEGGTNDIICKDDAKNFKIFSTPCPPIYIVSVV